MWFAWSYSHVHHLNTDSATNYGYVATENLSCSTWLLPCTNINISYEHKEQKESLCASLVIARIGGGATGRVQSYQAESLPRLIALCGGACIWIASTCCFFRFRHNFEKRLFCVSLHHGPNQLIEGVLQIE